MGAIADIWESERGLIGVLLILAATVLAALGKLPISDWKEYTLYIFGIYATAKTATGVATIWKSAKSSSSATVTPDQVSVTTTGTPNAPQGGA